MICSDFSTDVLKFYNSHSLIHSKEVFYSFKIIPPEFEFTGAILDETESADPVSSEGALTQKTNEKESADPVASEGALTQKTNDNEQY